MYTFPDGTLRPCAARYGRVYTARVDEHVHGSVWDVYTTVYLSLIHISEPTRPY